MPWENLGFGHGGQADFAVPFEKQVVIFGDSNGNERGNGDTESRQAQDYFIFRNMFWLPPLFSLSHRLPFYDYCGEQLTVEIQGN